MMFLEMVIRLLPKYQNLKEKLNLNQVVKQLLLLKKKFFISQCD